jgi:hypothetical protein
MPMGLIGRPEGEGAPMTRRLGWLAQKVGARARSLEFGTSSFDFRCNGKGAGKYDLIYRRIRQTPPVDSRS